MHYSTDQQAMAGVWSLPSGHPAMEKHSRVSRCLLGKRNRILVDLFGVYCCCKCCLLLSMFLVAIVVVVGTVIVYCDCHNCCLLLLLCCDCLIVIIVVVYSFYYSCIVVYCCCLLLSDIHVLCVAWLDHPNGDLHRHLDANPYLPSYQVRCVGEMRSKNKHDVMHYRVLFIADWRNSLDSNTTLLRLKM